MSLRLGDTAPDFTAETTDGSISFHAWIGACCLSFTRSRFHLMSAAVSGSPLWKVTPLWSRKTWTRSPWISHSRASSGLNSTPLPSGEVIFRRPL